jgi:hypothetical protein
MKKENIIKALLVFGGGYVLFLMLKPTLKDKKSFTPTTPKSEAEGKKEQKPTYTEQDYQNAEIVANAYTEALKNGEVAETLTELNKELMKEFNMRCYLDKSNQIVVCDAKGNTILKK